MPSTSDSAASSARWVFDFFVYLFVLVWFCKWYHIIFLPLHWVYTLTTSNMWDLKALNKRMSHVSLLSCAENTPLSLFYV